MSTKTDAPHVGNLIDLSEDADLSNVCDVTTTSDNMKEEDTEKAAIKVFRKKNYGRLCGYLNKLGSRGIIKTFRKRWFIFSPENCKLYYYRSPQDQFPLGEIDISKATFTFDALNKDRAGLFTISVPDKSYLLEADSRQTCLFWLQELQKFRRANSLLRIEQIRDKSNSEFNLVKRPKSGLLGGNQSFDLESTNEVPPSPLTIDVGFLSEDVASESQMANNNPLLIAQQKLQNLRNQLRNRQKTSSDSSASGNSLSDPEKVVPSSNSTFFSDLSLMEAAPCPPSLSKVKNHSLSAIRSKISESFRRNRSGDEEEGSETAGMFSWRNACVKCRGSIEKIDNLSGEVSSLQDEISASRLLIKALQTQLNIVSKEKETLMQLNKQKDSATTLEMLLLKDNEIAALVSEIQELKQKVENLDQQVTLLKKELATLRKENDIFQETLQRKDSTIVSLTNEMFDMETEKRDNDLSLKASRSISSLPENLPDSSQEANDFDNLKIAVSAYEVQNKFLNKEVLELNELRCDSEQRELSLSMKCSEWEARCCQVQSKLLSLLNELKKPDSERSKKDVISRLLEEAMADCDADAALTLPKWSIEEAYDDLGFNWKWGKDDLLSIKAQNLKQRSEDITNKVKEELEINSWRARWDNFMVALGEKELHRSLELKVLLRMGVPREYKGRIWRGCIEMSIKYYKMNLGQNYYDKLLNSEEFMSRIDPSSKQIELDLLRTLPNNRHYENIDSDGIPKLRRVLLAYSRHDPVVGYCQGLNRLAAIALLFLEEEDAFWCIVAIVKYLMPEDYYSRTLIASQVDQRVLKDLMADKLPRLHLHLEQCNIDLSLFTFNWFLTVYVDNVPVETYLRIWDVFLYEGSKVLFRYALTFFKYRENEILQIKDYIALSRYLRSMAEGMTDIKRISQIAFGDLNPFPQRVIDTKRSQHMFVVKAQMDEFESIRKSLPRNSEKEIAANYPSEED